MSIRHGDSDDGHDQSFKYLAILFPTVLSREMMQIQGILFLGPLFTIIIRKVWELMLMSKETNPQQNSTVQQKINETVQQSRILEAYMNDIVAKEATAFRLIEEARLAAAALHGIVSDNQTEALVPVGIGVYLRALIPPLDKLLVNVGAGTSVEKNKQDAINYVEARIKEFEVAAQQLADQKQQIELRMAQIQEQINQLLQQSSGVRRSSSGTGSSKR
jgi:prefoldin alpha subunit